MRAVRPTRYHGYPPYMGTPDSGDECGLQPLPLRRGRCPEKSLGAGKGVRHRFVPRQACLRTLRAQATVVVYLQAPPVFRVQVTTMVPRQRTSNGAGAHRHV